MAAGSRGTKSRISLPDRENISEFFTQLLIYLLRPVPKLFTTHLMGIDMISVPKSCITVGAGFKPAQDNDQEENFLYGLQKRGDELPSDLQECSKHLARLRQRKVRLADLRPTDGAKTANQTREETL